MKHILLLFLLTVLCGCTGDKKVDRSTLGEGADTTLLAKGYDVIDLFKTRTGHITATLYVNGKPCVFLVDTGGGATLIDRSKSDRFGLEASGAADYAAGIGSVSPLIRAKAVFHINGYDMETEEIYLMDISYINSEFRKNRARQVDGVLGTDFLDKYEAVIDYAHCKLYLMVASRHHSHHSAG